MAFVSFRAPSRFFTGFVFGLAWPFVLAAHCVTYILSTPKNILAYVEDLSSVVMCCVIFSTKYLLFKPYFGFL